MDSPEATISVIRNWHKGLTIGMFATGARNWQMAKDIQFLQLSR
jgi:hypothetical protein